MVLWLPAAISLQLMAAKFHRFPFSPDEPVGVLSFVSLIKALLFVEVFIWGTFSAEVVETPSPGLLDEALVFH